MTSTGGRLVACLTWKVHCPAPVMSDVRPNNMNHAKPKLSCHPARLVRHDGGTSSFGGEAAHEGTQPADWKQPLHLVATLDAASEFFPLEVYPHATLPLYYPFASSSPLLQYRVKSDDEIEIIHVSCFQLDTRPMIETTLLPPFQADLVAFSYVEARAIALSSAFPSYELLPEDKRYIEDSEAYTSVMTGVNLRTFQGDISHTCRNRHCQSFDRTTTLNIFCIVPCSRELAPDPHWGNYPKFVDLIFGLCPFCGTLVSLNVST